MQVSSTRMYMNAPKSWKIYLLHAPFVLRIVAFVMIVLVLARPQTTDNWQNTEIEGIDIMLAVDVSTSMLAEDLKPNRLEAAKQVAAEFINGRPNDNIGLTVFAGEAFTQCPLTVDYDVKENVLRLSLLRSGKHPDYLQDLGYHEFTYELLPHTKDFVDGGVVQAAHQLNNPMLITEGTEQTPNESLFTLDNCQIEIDAVKKSEDGRYLVIRFHDFAGSRQRVIGILNFLDIDFLIIAL